MTSEKNFWPSAQKDLATPLNFDENLSEAVRKYPVLYDKRSPRFKDKNKNKQALSDSFSEVKII